MTVSKELIENVKYLKKAINEVSVYDLNTYSTMELYYNIAKKLNEVINELSRFEGVVSDEVVEQNEKLLYLLDEGLTTEIIKNIKQMVLDGTMDTIINSNVFNGLNSKIDTFKQELEVQTKRVDSFTSLGQGSTTGDAELIDARVGADNVIYNNLGNSLRYQLSNSTIKQNIINKKLDSILKEENLVYQTDYFYFVEDNPQTYKKVSLFEKTITEITNLRIGLDSIVSPYTNDGNTGVSIYGVTSSGTETKIGAIRYNNAYDTVIKVDNSIYKSYKLCVMLNYGTKTTLGDVTKMYNIKIYEGIKTNNKFLSEEIIIKSKQIDNNGGVPTYYQTHIADKISTINKLSSQIGVNEDNFIFLTDIHVPSNANNSSSLIKEILNKSNINNVICGGDLINAHSKENAQNYINQFVNDYNSKGIELLNLFGNHELNTMGNSDTTAYLTFNEIYSKLVKQIEKKTNTNKQMNYYIDNESQKIRYIFINSGTNGNIGYVSSSLSEHDLQFDQRIWLLDTLKNTKNGWKIGVFTHWIATPVKESLGEITLTNGTGLLIKNILDSVKNKTTYSISPNNWDFSDKELDIMFVLAGHVHRDYVFQYSSSYPIICTTTDAWEQNYDDVTVTRTKGTTTEQAFDVVQIDTKNRKIYCTRIGAGADRLFTY